MTRLQEDRRLVSGLKPARAAELARTRSHSSERNSQRQVLGSARDRSQLRARRSAPPRPAAGSALVTRSTRERVIQHVTPAQVCAFEKEIVRIDGPEPLALVRKRRPDCNTIASVVLIHGFGQNRYVWHLPQRSLANHLAYRGFDVFNVDLRGHGRSAALGAARSRGVDDYIRGDLPAVLRGVRELSGSARILMVGHSLGGVCAAAAAAQAREQVAGVVAIGSPHVLGRRHFVLGSALRIVHNAVVKDGSWRGSQRRVPVDLIGKTVHAVRYVWDSPFAMIPVRAWKRGSFESAALRSYLRSCDGGSFGTLDDLLELGSSGELRSRLDGRSYTKLIEESTLPLLVIAGAADTLVHPRDVKVLYERSQSPNKRYLTFDAGHADLLLGRTAPETVWPVLTSWLAEHALPGTRQRLRERAASVQPMHASLGPN